FLLIKTNYLNYLSIFRIPGTSRNSQKLLFTRAGFGTVLGHEGIRPSRIIRKILEKKERPTTLLGQLAGPSPQAGPAVEQARWARGAGRAGRPADQAEQADGPAAQTRTR